MLRIRCSPGWARAATALQTLAVAALTASPVAAQVGFHQTQLRPHVPGPAMHLREGELFTATTRGHDGSEAGQPVLRLRGPGGERLAQSERRDGFAGSGALLHYTVPEGASGEYHLELACPGAGGSCRATVAHRTVASAPAPQLPPAVHVETTLRGLIGVEGGAGLIADFVLEVRLADLLVARAGSRPGGIGGGGVGGLLGGSVYAAILLDLGFLAFGLGGGLAVVAERDQVPERTETGTIVLSLRGGRRAGVRVEADAQLDVLTLEEPLSSFVAAVRFPITPELELAFRGAGGDNGVVLGESTLSWWFARDPGSTSAALSLHVGGGGIFYRPVCRFGRSCTGATWYAGPTVGGGVEFSL